MPWYLPWTLQPNTTPHVHFETPDPSWLLPGTAAHSAHFAAQEPWCLHSDLPEPCEQACKALASFGANALRHLSIMLPSLYGKAAEYHTSQTTFSIVYITHCVKRSDKCLNLLIESRRVIKDQMVIRLNVHYFAMTVRTTTMWNSDMIGSGWLSRTAFDWPRPVTQNDFGSHCKQLLPMWVVAVLIGQWMSLSFHARLLFCKALYTQWGSITTKRNDVSPLDVVCAVKRQNK